MLAVLALALATLQSADDADWKREREAALALRAPVATLSTLDEWRATILPTPEESAWSAIPWLASFADGIRRADADRKPLLLWAMNGHPLGCT